MDKQEKNMDFQGSGSTTYDTVKGTHDTEFIKTHRMCNTKSKP